MENFPPRKLLFSIYRIYPQQSKFAVARTRERKSVREPRRGRRARARGGQGAGEDRERRSDGGVQLRRADESLTRLGDSFFSYSAGINSE